mmetsp:Transcript_15668/g.47732  ORF Transcript_15668/g.47732 Transcript_15668/m.47732 type:complete len:93 (+) Transcript_15668:1003-1281(+)
MKKNVKLQEWLQQKEEKELAAIQAEEDQIERQQREKEDRDRKFKVRAAKQKAKLMRYYAQQEAMALAEQTIPDGGGYLERARAAFGDGEMSV